MIDDTLSVVFYDLTTIRTEGLSEQPNDLRRPGMSKEGIVARQFLLGVVQTADGLPIHHEVFNGNASEGPTLLPVLKRVLQRFAHIHRLVLVADRGLLSLDNLKVLEELALPDGALGPRKLEYIRAVPGRRYGEFEPVLADPQVQVAAHAAQAAAFAYRFNRRFNLRDLVARLIVDVARAAPTKEELVRTHAEARS